MMTKSKLTCVVFGGETLTVRCCERLLERQFEILAIVTDNSELVQWAQSRSLTTYPDTHGSVDALSTTPFDYIFSIDYLKLLPQRLIDKAQAAAINFHDGRLPDYAGLNAPVWAIINRETNFEVNWHLMEKGIDQGGVLIRTPVPIDSNETTLSLNIKCHEAGLRSFEQLLQHMQTGHLEPSPQNLEGYRCYRRCDKPAASATLMFDQEAETLEALVRALTFGPYENTVSVAKLYLGNDLCLVTELSLTEQASSTPPGTIIEVTDTLVVSTATTNVRIGALLSFGNEPIAVKDALSKAGLSKGDVLPRLTEDQKTEISQGEAQACQSGLTYPLDSDLLKLPYAGKAASAVSDSYGCLIQNTADFFEADQEGTDTSLAKTLFIYLSILGQKSHYDIAFNRITENSASKRDLYFDPQNPLSVRLDPDASLQTNWASMTRPIKQHLEVPGIPRDSFVRLPEALRHQTRPLAERMNDIGIYLTANNGERKPLMEGALILVIPEGRGEIHWHYQNSRYSKTSVMAMQQQFETMSHQIPGQLDQPLKSLSILTAADVSAYQKVQGRQEPAADKALIHHLIEHQAARAPNSTALVCLDETLTYAELNQRANHVAYWLLNRGVKPDDLVGVLIGRSINTVIAMVGVLKAGGAYLPLDPSYPQERIGFMLEDANVFALITEQHLHQTYSGVPNTLIIDHDFSETETLSGTNPESPVWDTSLAYTIYTSGSTGKPKGVMVEHRQVVNFFHGMDETIGEDEAGTWLAVTSISFDISVLEILWTLARGFKVVLYLDEQQASRLTTKNSHGLSKPMAFSLFYWNVADDEDQHKPDKYRLLIESAKYGDQHGFSAIWTPERHFHSFGGLYPNPSVTSAALATITENIDIRAGSCVLPLHHPVRVVEEWSMVDNLSNGRVGLAMAAGWQPNDFVLQPENHARAKDIMFESINQVKALWRGETLSFPGPNGKPVEVRTLPRPIQPNIPIWITTAGNPETFRQAGEIGANILTHLLGQSVEDVSKNLEIYRDAYQKAGHPGSGEVTVLLHTLVGADKAVVKELARAPMKNYLKTAMFLVKAAAWHFPTFKEKSSGSTGEMDEYFANISDEDMDQLLEFAFERYFSTSGLFGTPESCQSMVDSLLSIGVTEIGCLIDYGLDTDTLLEHLPFLNEVKNISQSGTDVTGQASLGELIRQHEVTHFQCTPSMAAMLLDDPDAADALQHLKVMMVGGEALPVAVANKLRDNLTGPLINMYGPTETTIWSTTHRIEHAGDEVPIGRGIANTQLYVMDGHARPMPVGVPGELVIGGAGVVRGYHKRPDLTAERFMHHGQSIAAGQTLYRTGDLVRLSAEGVLQYLGRLDHQVKIRGYRVELGEIETAMANASGVKSAVVVARADDFGTQQLVAYVVPEPGASIQPRSLQSALRQHLPEFMVPGLYVSLTEFPLTPNGKVDRKALPHPGETATAPPVIEAATLETNKAARAKEYQPSLPGTQRNATTENNATLVNHALIEEIWGRLLGVPVTDRTASFFDIGGHSILAVKVQGELRKTLGRPVPITDIFRFPTIEKLVQRLNETA